MESTDESSLLHDSALQSQLPDVRVQVIYYMFLVNAIFCVGCILVGAIPYYHYFGRRATEYAFIGVAIGWSLTYVLMSFAVFEQYLQVALWIAGLWAILTAAFIGFASALSYNISPIQFMLVSFAQSITMVIYTRLSNRYVSVVLSGVYMLIASVLAWILCIYGFVVENDWISAGVIAVLAIALVFYNTMQIQNTASRYDASWEKGVTAVLQYYCDYMVKIFKCAIKNG